MSATKPKPDLPSISLVVPWFGPLPVWFDIWLVTCGANPTIDWLLFTDEPLEGRPVPANVHVHEISLAGLRRRFNEMLGMEVNLSHPYLLCNLKLAYGFLFAKELAGYELWGYCDADVVWGDLRRFFPAELLRAYPKLQQNAHLTLYQNTPETVELFRQPHPDPHKDYRVVFREDHVVNFCEWYGAHELAYLAGLDQYLVERFVDVDQSSAGLRGIGLRNYEHQLFYWEDGRLFREYIDDPGVDPEDAAWPRTQRDEFAYLHLQKRRMSAPGFDPSAVRGFYITPHGFVQKVKAAHCLDDFRLFNPRGPQPAADGGTVAVRRRVRRLARSLRQRRR